MNQPNRRPKGMTNELLWDVSYTLEQQHRGQFTDSGSLVCCDQEFPCPSAQLAARGLLAAERLSPPAPATPERFVVWRRWRVAVVVRRPTDT
jgi:hypothetical protein